MANSRLIEKADYDVYYQVTEEDSKGFVCQVRIPPGFQRLISKEFGMSIESARAFVERMKTDGEFRRRVAEAESREVRARILKYEGFDFTDEELDSLKEEVKKSLGS